MNTVTRMMMFVGMIAVAQPALSETKNPAEGQESGQTKVMNVEHRIERQNHRIERKLKKKKISEEKAAELKQEVKAVEEKKEEVKKDGKVTQAERKELHQNLNKVSQDIKAAGHSEETKTH